MFEVRPPSVNGFHFGITKWPTGNCQLSSISYLYSFFLNNVKKEDVVEIIKHCYARIGQPMNLILVDVNNQYIPKVEECFKVVHKYPYVSTNQSNMCLFVVKI